MNNIIVDRKLLESIYNALNIIPNHYNVGKNGESSYELASDLSNILNKPSQTTNEQPKCYKYDSEKGLCCSTCKKFCTITGESIPNLRERFKKPCSCGRHSESYCADHCEE